MLADFLCLAEGQESSSSDQTASCSLLQSPAAANDSRRSSFDSDRSSHSDSFRTSSSAFPERSGFVSQSYPQSFSAHPAASCSLLSLRLDHEDVLSAWHKMSGGKAAFCHQRSASTPASLLRATSSSFVPLVPQECQHTCQQSGVISIPTDSSRPMYSGKLQQSSAASTYPGACCSQLPLGTADPAEPGPVSRQARLDRYREKKRTRGFSSKIRYEMRKINAERRPRVKGRFVKRGDMPETFDEILDPLADYDPIDFGMLTALDICEESYLL